MQTELLDTLQPNYQAITKLSREFNTIGIHVFEFSNDPSLTAHCRNFAPLYGIDEESATGSASGALGCYLVKYVFPTQTHFQFEQGRAMACSSLIHVIVDTPAKEINRVRVSGKATMISTKIIKL